MNAVVAVAALTVREAVRRRIVTVAAILGVALVALTSWGFSKLHDGIVAHGRDPALAASSFAALVVMLAFMFSVALCVGAAFLGASAIAADIAGGILLAIVPRPIRRSDIIFGKLCGLATLLFAFAFAIGGAELAACAAITGYVPPHPWHALAYLCAQAELVLLLTLALGTRLAPIASGLVAIAAFGLSWIAGIAAVAGATFANAALVHGATAASLLLPSDGLWRGALWSLEPAALVALGATAQGARALGPFAIAGPPLPAFLAWTSLWSAAVLVAGLAAFRARDL